MASLPTLADLFRPASLAELPPPGRRLVGGLRRWAYAAEGGEWPVRVLQRDLGCASAAAHAQLLVEELAVAWPEPFCVAPPCCRRATHDEALLAAMLGKAGEGDRPGFDRLCAEMICGDARERLFLSLRLLAGTLAH